MAGTMIKGEMGKMRVRSGQGLEDSLVLWGGQCGAMGGLRAELGHGSQGCTSAFLRNGLAAPIHQVTDEET